MFTTIKSFTWICCGYGLYSKNIVTIKEPFIEEMITEVNKDIIPEEADKEEIDQINDFPLVQECDLICCNIEIVNEEKHEIIEEKFIESDAEKIIITSIDGWEI